MRDPRGQLPDSLQPLHLAQGRFNPFALRDLRDQLPIGGPQFGGAFLDPRFQGFIQTPKLRLGETGVGFTLVQGFQPRTRFVLPSATPQGRVV